MEDLARLEQLNKERDALLLRTARARGLAVWLVDDSRYGQLHDDLTVKVIAEGTILVGPPHMLSFTYDDLNPSYVQVIQPTSAVRRKEPVFADFSDSDDEGGGLVRDEEEAMYETKQRIAIPATSVTYEIDLPRYVSKGSRHRFFVIAPSLHPE